MTLPDARSAEPFWRAALRPLPGLALAYYIRCRAGRGSDRRWLSLALLGACRVAELGLLLILSGLITVVDSLGRTIVALADYARNKQMAILDGLSACTRLDRWARRTVLVFAGYHLGVVEWWLAAPLVVAGPMSPWFTRATIGTDTLAGRAAAIVYQLHDVPTLSDLQAVLRACDLADTDSVAFRVYLSRWAAGGDGTASVGLAIDIKTRTVSVDDNPPRRIPFGSLDLGSLLSGYSRR